MQSVEGAIMLITLNTPLLLFMHLKYSLCTLKNFYEPLRILIHPNDF